MTKPKIKKGAIAGHCDICGCSAAKQRPRFWERIDIWRDSLRLDSVQPDLEWIVCTECALTVAEYVELLKTNDWFRESIKAIRKARK